MPRELDRFVYREINRHGNPVYYFRRGKGPRTRLPDPFRDRDAYDSAYRTARDAATPPPARKAGHGTLAWLIEQYRASGDYLAFSPATRRQRDNIFRGVKDKAGHLPLIEVTPARIRQGVADRAGTPYQARHFLDAMRGMFEWAVGAEHIAANPALGIRPPKPPEGDGHEPWSADDVARYERRWPAGTKERVWMHVLLYTGLRRGDAVVLGRQHVRDGIATLRTEKTGTEVTIRLPAALVATLAAGPTGDLTYIVGERGAPLVKESFGNLFREACNEAKVNKSAHGLRKLAATIAAEAGASEAELDALFGWTGRKMAALYTRKAERKRLALQAADRIANASAPHLSSVSPHPKKRKVKSVA